MIQNFAIGQLEKGILLRHGRFVRVLEAGANTVYGHGYTVQRYALESRFEHGLKDFLLEKHGALVEKHFVNVQTGAFQVAVVWRGEEALDLIEPNQTALFWKGFKALRIEHLPIVEGLKLEGSATLARTDLAAFRKKHFSEVAPGATHFAVVWRGGVVRDLIRNGERRLYWAKLEDLQVNVCATNTVLHKALTEALLETNPAWLEALTIVNLSQTEAAVLRRGANIVQVFAPGTHAMLMLDVGLKLEVIDSNAFEVALPLARQLRGTALESFIAYAEIPEGHIGLMTLDKKYDRVLNVGEYAFWKTVSDVGVTRVDLRLQSLEVSGQEMLSKDKVGLRMTLLASYRINDAQMLFAQVADHHAFLYKELQFALRGVVGARTLDALLDEKTALDDEIAALVRGGLEGKGITLESVGIRDIILPGEMKTILAKVVEAEKQAQANLIRRREETAATRSLLNTAKVMEDNPVALRLKELEALERITEKVQSLNVSNGLDGVLNDLVRLRP